MPGVSPPWCGASSDNCLIFSYSKLIIMPAHCCAFNCAKRWYQVSGWIIPTSRWDRLNDDRYVLHSLLPPRSEYSYNFRRRRHDYELIAKTLNTDNFIMRMLYKKLLITAAFRRTAGIKFLPVFHSTQFAMLPHNMEIVRDHRLTWRHFTLRIAIAAAAAAAVEFAWCAGSDVMKTWRRQVRENHSAMTQSTVSRYVIVILLLGNMTLLHMLPQVTFLQQTDMKLCV